MSQPSKRRIPKSRAKTAYGLLTEIENVAKVEPLRIDMSNVLAIGSRAHQLSEAHAKPTPSCGTVGCVAGWAMFLRGKRSNISSTFDARGLLGLSAEQGLELFHPTKLLYAENVQTPEHAQETIKHIRAFKAKYSRQLRAHRLPEVKTNA